MAALYECVYVCCIALYACMCSLYSSCICIQLYSAKDINDVAPPSNVVRVFKCS